LEENATVFDALKALHTNGLSSIALTDSKNLLTANLSVADFKYLLQRDQLDALHLTCKLFVQEVRICKDRENDFKTTLPVFVVTKDSTLFHTLGKLIATKTHRLWVVKSSSDHHLIGCISLSDILRGLTPKNSQHRWEEHPYIDFVPAST